MRPLVTEAFRAALLCAALGVAIGGGLRIRGLAEATAEGTEEPGVAARVHDHAAYVFRVPDGARTPAQRAVEASKNLGAIVDDDLPGALTISLDGGVASVQVGSRQVFRVTPADAVADGAANLDEYAPRLQAQLDDFLLTERRRSQLQHGVLGLALVIFMATLSWLLIRGVERMGRRWEERLETAELSPRLVSLGLTSARARGLVLVGLVTARIAAQIGAVVLFLLGSLSLFERTLAWRDRLMSWLAAPVLALGGRLIQGLPSLLLLFILWIAVLGAWRAVSVGFDRIAQSKVQSPGLEPHQVVPYRLLSRAAVVLAALLLIPPLVLGEEATLYRLVGLLLLGAGALAAVPLCATVFMGTWAMLTNAYRPGEWLTLRLGGREITGEVTAVDFFQLRLVPAEGGEIRVPHLAALWAPVLHPRQSSMALSVEVPAPRAQLSPARALEALQAAARQVSAGAGLKATPSVTLVEMTAETARFRVVLAEAPESLRTALLVSLGDALYRVAEGGRPLEPVE